MDCIGNIKRKNIPFFADEQAFLEFANRVTHGKYQNKICFEQVKSTSGYDEYSLFAKNGMIHIAATCGCAGGTALNAYLRKYCHYYIGILTQSGTLPDSPPDTTEILTEQSRFHYRYAFNFCTFGYSYAFNDWNDWERITDYLILSGYNLVLNPIGNECVWAELLQKFGYTKEEAYANLSAPNYLPWQWMMNLSGFESNYSDAWFQKQKEICRRFDAKLKQFGMSSVLPGYCGVIPHDFQQKHPNTSVLQQGKWEGFQRPPLLMQNDPLFEQFAKEYYTLQKALLNSADVHYYAIDPFHEGGKKRNVDLPQFAKTVFRVMQQSDKDAVWVLQGWQKNPNRQMLTALPKENVLILNLHADHSPDGGDDFCGYPHVYCVVNNFGGEYAMRGSAEKTYITPHELVRSENSSCVGIGIMPEGVVCDEILFDILGEISIRSNLRSMDEFLWEYTQARYGVATDELVDMQKRLFAKFYNEDTVEYAHESGLLARPCPDVNRVCHWAGAAIVEDDTELYHLTETLLKYYPACKDRESYCTDLIALTRQLIANRSWAYIYGLQTAYLVKDQKSFEENATRFLELFDLQSNIMKHDPNWNLRAYLEKAEKRGNNAKEKDWLVKAAKRLITLWGDEISSVELHDYAAREYPEMLSLFYKPRWKKYINSLDRSLKANQPWNDYDRYADENQFVNRDTVYPKQKSSALFDDIRTVLQYFDPKTKQ